MSVMIGPMTCPVCHAVLPEYDELRAEVERWTQQGRLNEEMMTRATMKLKDLQAENKRLRAALTEIMQGARSVDYAIHVARVALANATE